MYLGQSDMFFHDGDSRIVCVHRANCLRLQTEDLLDVSNRIQDAFSFYSKWKNTCMEAIADQCGLSELLDLSADIFHMPILDRGRCTDVGCQIVQYCCISEHRVVEADF